MFLQNWVPTPSLWLMGLLHPDIVPISKEHDPIVNTVLRLRDFLRFSFSKAMEFRVDFTFRIIMDLAFYTMLNFLFFKIIQYIQQTYSKAT